MIPALSDREIRCQLLYERSEVDRQGRSRTRNSNSGHRDADSPACSDARPSWNLYISNNALTRLSSDSLSIGVDSSPTPSNRPTILRQKL